MVLGRRGDGDGGDGDDAVAGRQYAEPASGDLEDEERNTPEACAGRSWARSRARARGRSGRPLRLRGQRGGGGKSPSNGLLPMPGLDLAWVVISGTMDALDERGARGAGEGSIWSFSGET